MSSEHVPIPQLLEKMRNNDKDYRFMAINDLMERLRTDAARWDDDLESKIVRMILDLLDDKTGEVQNQSVKCLGPLVGKIKDKQVEFVVDRLCNNMVGDKEELRDISSIGLKTVISELPMSNQSLASAVCKTIVGRLSVSIAQQKDESVQLEALDILVDLLIRFGDILVHYHSDVLDSLKPQLSSPRVAVRKRTIVALGNLVVTCDMKIYCEIISLLVKGLQSQENNVKASEVVANTKTFVQAIGTVCRQAGSRFSDYVETTIPLVLKHAAHEDEELREQCLQACESIVLKCGKEVSPHIRSITKVCLEYIAYDPNYNYDDEDEDDKMECDDQSDNEEEPDEDYSDNEDISWKVRKAASKCLLGLIQSRPELLNQYYTFSPDLVKRFKEREESVKAEILNTYVAILKQTKVALKNDENKSNLDANMNGDAKTCLDLLLNQVPLLIKALRKQLKENSVTTRQASFQFLSILASVSPNILGPYALEIVPWVQFSLQRKDCTSNLKIDILEFMQNLIESLKGTTASSSLIKFLPVVIKEVADSFYKISSEALMILSKLIQVLRPQGISDSVPQVDLRPHAKDIYQACLNQMVAKEKERQGLMKKNKFDEHAQEVEERAISCMGQIIASLGDFLSNELESTLKNILDLLKNERTKLITAKSLITISESSLSINISPVLEGTLQTLQSYLQCNQRDLKIVSLELIATLIDKHTTAANEKNLKLIIGKLSDVINDSDLHVAQLAIELITSVARKHKHVLSTISQTGFQPVFKLAGSPLLQGAALQSLLKFFPVLIEARLPGLGFNDVLDKLSNLIISPKSGSNEDQLQKHGRASVAKCISGVVRLQTSKEAQSTVQNFINVLKGKEDVHEQTFSLLVLAEIGKQVDLSTNKLCKETILDKFSHSNEEVKTAASYALGCLSVGNLSHFLDLIIKKIESQPALRYLLLISLKEVINMQSNGQEMQKKDKNFLPYIGNIWDLLFKHTEDNEEGTRNVVSECLGKLCLHEPHQLLPKLQDALKSTSALKRSTVLSSVKFMISEQPHPIDALLTKTIGSFLQSVTDPDLNVKKMALIAFNSAAHNKPTLIRSLLPTILPQLYNETIKRMDLVRMVEMGPFKHEVDDGLDLRKTAFECMYTLLDTCFENLDITEFLVHVQDGLKDHNDIKMLSYLMLSYIAKNCPKPILSNIESVVERLQATLKSKLKSNALKQEHEKLDEVKRSAIRSITTLISIPGADQNVKMKELLSYIKSTVQLNDFLEAARRDTDIKSRNDNTKEHHRDGFSKKENLRVSQSRNGRKYGKENTYRSPRYEIIRE